MGTLAHRASHLHGVCCCFLGCAAGWMVAVELLSYFDFVAVFLSHAPAGRWCSRRALENLRRPAPRTRLAPVGGFTFRKRGRKDSLSRRNSNGRPDPAGTGRDRAGTGIRDLLPRSSVSRWINGEPEPRLIERGGEVPAAVEVGGAGSSRNAGQVRRLAPGQAAGSFGPPPASRNGRDLGKVLRWYLGIIIGIAAAGGDRRRAPAPAPPSRSRLSIPSWWFLPRAGGRPCPCWTKSSWPN